MIDVVGVKRAFFSAALIFAVCLNGVERAKAADAGEEMYNVNCGICHTIGSGRLVGPDLAGVQERRSQEWLLSFVKSSQSLIGSGDADAIAVFEEYSRIPMPDPPLTISQIKEVLEHIRTKSANTEVTAPDMPDDSDLLGGVQQAANIHATVTNRQIMGLQGSGNVEPLGAVASNSQLGVGPRPDVTAQGSRNVEPLGAGTYNPQLGVGPRPDETGQNLFQGTLRFTNSGPACNSCHDVRNDAVIGGGILAAELTTVFSRMGGAGVRAVLGSPPWPVMQAAYQGKPLRQNEIVALIAFLQRADADQIYQQPRDYGVGLLVVGLGGVTLLFGICSLLWRGRKKGSVNQSIYDRQVRSVWDIPR